MKVRLFLAVSGTALFGWMLTSYVSDAAVEGYALEPVKEAEGRVAVVEGSVDASSLTVVE
ncbi:MAG: hypothetical protein AAGC74_03970 [Verrucomicrobiota bacterium]